MKEYGHYFKTSFYSFIKSATDLNEQVDRQRNNEALGGGEGEGSVSLMFIWFIKDIYLLFIVCSFSESEVYCLLKVCI